MICVSRFLFMRSSKNNLINLNWIPWIMIVPMMPGKKPHAANTFVCLFAFLRWKIDFLLNWCICAGVHWVSQLNRHHYMWGFFQQKMISINKNQILMPIWIKHLTCKLRNSSKSFWSALVSLIFLWYLFPVKNENDLSGLMIWPISLKSRH